MNKDYIFNKPLKIWFYISCFVMFFGGIIDAINGKVTETNAWGASISIFILYLILKFIFKNKNKFSKVVNKIPFSFITKSIIIGWLFAELDELINFPFNSLTPGITLINDIILTTPIYIFTHLFWFFILKKYKFSIQESLIIGGISGALSEFIFSGALNAIILGALILPFMIMIHGFHMIMPRLLLDNYFKNLKQKETKWKYFWAILLTLLGTSIGVGVAQIVGLIIKI